MDYSKKDMKLWLEWKRSPTPMNLQRVVDALNPLIQKEVNRWSGALARPVLELEAKRLAAEAIKTYNPSVYRASLSTHVSNRLKKLSRMSYTYQNVARIPEHHVSKFTTLYNAKADFEEKYGREPTIDELSDRLGWSRNYLTQVQRQTRSEFIESGDLPPAFDSPTDQEGLLDYIYHDLSPQEKKLFEYTTGYGGSPILSNKQIMKKLRLTQGQLSYQKQKLINKVQQLSGGGLS